MCACMHTYMHSPFKQASPSWARSVGASQKTQRRDSEGKKSLQLLLARFEEIMPCHGEKGVRSSRRGSGRAAWAGETTSRSRWIPYHFIQPIRDVEWRRVFDTRRSPAGSAPSVSISASRVIRLFFVSSSTGLGPVACRWLFTCWPHAFRFALLCSGWKAVMSSTRRPVVVSVLGRAS